MPAFLYVPQCIVMIDSRFYNEIKQHTVIDNLLYKRLDQFNVESLFQLQTIQT